MQREASVNATDEVLAEKKGCAGVLTLNRPRQLNALSLAMTTQLHKYFKDFEENPAVKLLILKGNGRAFCAGGDVAAVIRDIGRGDWTEGAKFFSSEFILDYIIATYTKPQVALLHGIVMGGGAGLSQHGKFRVATENTVFAMPETALGLFPDIGASYFLSRLPGFFGEYVGLTGARLDGAEMLACGLATHFVPSSTLTSLEESLTKADSSDCFVLCGIIDRFSQQAPLKESSAYNSLDVIDKCFSKGTVEEILLALKEEASQVKDKWIHTAIQSIQQASPTSLKITLRAIREGRLRTVGECLMVDYRLCCQISRGNFSRDFFEGCRAILLDKDRNPKWSPPRLELVENQVVDKYFGEVDDDHWEDLKLPARGRSRTSYVSKI